MNSITAASRRTVRHPIRLALLTAPLAVLLVTVLTLVTFNPFGQSSAVAYGPMPLRWAPMSQSESQVLHQALDRLSRAGGVGEPARTSTATSWSLSVSEAGRPEEVTTISPIVTELAWSDDLSGRRTVTAGAPYPAVSADIGADDVAAGTVLDDASFSAGTFPALVPEANTFEGSDFAEFLHTYAPTEDGALAGDAMLGVIDLFGEWTLTDSQHADLLNALFAYEGITVAGSAEDRLGRDVVGVSSPSAFRPGETTTLLISAETGRIVGVETVVTGEDASFKVPQGTVIQYTLWKDT